MTVASELVEMGWVDAIVPVACQEPQVRLMAHELSHQGLRVTGTKPLWPGTVVELICRPNHQIGAWKCTCRVVDLYDCPTGVGMELHYVHMDASARQRLSSWLQSMSA